MITIKKENKICMYGDGEFLGFVKNNNGIIELDLPVGTYKRISKIAYDFFNELKNSNALSAAVKETFGEVNTNKIEFLYGEKTVVVELGMTLNDVEKNCFYDNKIPYNSEGGIIVFESNKKTY